eukprot:scaffold60463_cov63-Phaeocystis_antarctica.AAC.1
MAFVRDIYPLAANMELRPLPPPPLPAATLARAAAWQRENPELAEKQAEFFHRLGLDPGGTGYYIRRPSGQGGLCETDSCEIFDRRFLRPTVCVAVD